MAAWLERVVWAWVGESEVEDSAVDSGTSVMEQMQMVLAISAGSGGELAVTGKGGQGKRRAGSATRTYAINQSFIHVSALLNVQVFILVHGEK
jgi:hypothetical protein